jgi:hypothetical protein
LHEGDGVSIEALERYGNVAEQVDGGLEGIDAWT